MVEYKGLASQVNTDSDRVIECTAALKKSGNTRPSYAAQEVSAVLWMGNRFRSSASGREFPIVDLELGKLETFLHATEKRYGLPSTSHGPVLATLGLAPALEYPVKVGVYIPGITASGGGAPDDEPCCQTKGGLKYLASEGVILSELSADERVQPATRSDTGVSVILSLLPSMKYVRALFSVHLSFLFVRVTIETSRHRHGRHPSKLGCAQTVCVRAAIGTTRGRTGRGNGIFI